MKNDTGYLRIVVLAIGLALPLSAVRTIAAPPPRNGEVAALQGAYYTLSRADHDYKGHRVKAMHEIQAACKLLGADPTGDATGKEAQRTSDAQLQTAQRILMSVRTTAVSANQAQLVQHIDNAINQINVALSIK